MAQPLKRPTKEVLERLYQREGLTQREIATRFGVCKTTVSKWTTFHGIPPRMVGRKQVKGIDLNILRAVVPESRSILAVLRKLGLRETGNNHARVTRLIQSLIIDTHHFLGRRSNQGGGHVGGYRYKEWKEILIKRTSGRREKRSRLKRALLETGREYICKCGLRSWLGETLTLEIHHINGDWLDNRPENLGFLCPNCHSLTENYCNKRKSL